MSEKRIYVLLCILISSISCVKDAGFEQARRCCTYYDDYSYYNIGFLTSIHINKINFYISANNLLEYTNLARARGASLQLGFNVIM